MPGPSANRKLCTSCPQDGSAEICPPAFSPQLFPLGTIRLFNWFVIGEKKNREKNLAEKPSLAKHYCTKLKYVRKQLIINELLVEATGVELFSGLITRKLLIPGTATAAKKAPLPDPFVRLLYENSFRVGVRTGNRSHLSIPQSSPWMDKAVQLPVSVRRQRTSEML